jgi:predicted phage baseplate assembly protein
MSQDCRNDCLESLVFPRRPGTWPRSAAGEDACSAPSNPVSPDNRPGLAHFNYRIGSYADIRAFLLSRLNQYETLATWTHREADDPGIALLEGAAILGDILSFYQDLYANEAFLRTAQWLDSVAELVRLLGYRLSPGVGGQASFAFEVKGDVPVQVPTRFPVKVPLEGQDKPADFETLAPLTAYPWLNNFSLFRPLESPPIVPGTHEFYIANPDPYAQPFTLKAGDRLLVGDAIGAGPSSLGNPEILIVDSVRKLHGVQYFKIKGSLKHTGNMASLAAFLLGRSFHHFGHNGPPTIVKTPNPATSTATQNGTTTTVKTNLDERQVDFTRRLDIDTTSAESTFFIYVNTGTYQFVGNPVKYSSKALSIASAKTEKMVSQTAGGKVAASASQPWVRIVKPTLAAVEFPLDAEVRDLANGATLIAQGRFATDSGAAQEFAVVRAIKEIRSTSVTWGQLTAATSLATLDQSLSASTNGHNQADIHELLLHEVLSPPLTLHSAQRDTAQATGHDLAFFGTYSQALNLDQRLLALTKPGATALYVQVAQVAVASPENPEVARLHRITLAQAVDYTDFPNEGPKVSVYGNLADASQGKTEAAAVVGNGDARAIFQTFKLPKTPLTYLISAQESPPETPELLVYVNNRLWTRVSSFFGRKGDEEIYIVREDADNISWVQFGDGKTGGARLPSGAGNVVAIYRTGNAAFGPPKAGAKAQAGAKLEGLDQVSLPGIATGGAKPEGADKAKAAAPSKIQSLDRLVALSDFESEVLAIAGVAAAAAAWRLVDNIPLVAVTVLMETGRGGEIQRVREVLARYKKGRGPQRFPVKVIAGARWYVCIHAQVAYDPTFRQELVAAQIALALGADGAGGLFGLRSRRFGGPEYATRIEGTIQNVPGVVWVKLATFAPLTEADNPASLDLSRFPETFNEIVACSGDQILALHPGHLTLTAVARGD